MSMRVHNADHFEELRQSALSVSGSPRQSQLGSASGGGGRNGSELSFSQSLSPGAPSRSYASELSRETQMKRVAMKHELYMKEQEAMQKKLAESIAENLQKQKTRKEAQYMKLLQDVEDGKALAEELHEKLELQEQSKMRQFQRMHEEWTTGVFEKLNEPVVSKVQAMDGRELSVAKHEAYQRFLDITNKKGALFRDIIIESEYNPLNDVKFLSHRVKVDDPVNRIIRRREEENTIARSGSNIADSSQRADLAGCGRTDNLDVKLWSAGVFESTPYGYFHRPAVSRSSDGGAQTYASRVKLDQYDVETGAEVLRKEFPRGKRTDFEAHAVRIPKTTIQLS
ncbi:hypothetical protein PybrP1_007445 [[Pythium] brassicae (nom. inval.)]|nr:hypothetical protein PybrP1_007445 [[Pythium] brassicae (nom. inval.)]